MSEHNEISELVSSEPQYVPSALQQRKHYERQQQPSYEPHIPPRRMLDFRSRHYTRRSQNH